MTRGDETAHPQDGRVCVLAHDLALCGQRHEGNDRERNAEGEGHLRDDEGPRGFGARPEDDERRDQGDEATRERAAP